jgi:release factor H-coupled RctB family protein
MQRTQSETEVLASARSWIEGAAVQQLERTAELPGMLRAVGMPDLHPGKGSPVGAAFLTEGIIYPALVGNDIGCGMGLWMLDAPARKPQLDKWERRLRGLEDPWDGDTAAWLAAYDVAPCGFEEALGTIGGGNHFAELQRVERVLDETVLEQIGLDANRVLLLVHSGSRGLGESVLQAHLSAQGHAGVAADADSGQAYLHEHDRAVRWAIANRALIAHRVVSLIGAEELRLLDVCHNHVEAHELGGRRCWLHHKGATPATGGPVIIPGSRGAWSYLVAPTLPPECPERGLFSLAHGAGRKFNRSEMKGRLRERLTVEQLTRTELGSRVICEDRDLLYEEAPQAYKNVDVVVQDLVDAGLARIAAVLRPLLTYKTRSRARD